MDFKHLQTFMAIAECGSATKAAEMLQIVQPAISRQMRILEQELGTTLFHRERSGMELTDAGRTLLEHARRVMRELDEARAKLQPSSAVISGLVRLGMPASTSDLLAGDVVDTVNKRHPQIRIGLHAGFGEYLQSALLEGALDLAIINDPQPSPLMETQFLLNEQLFLVGPLNSSLSPDQPLPVRALEGKPLVLAAAPHAVRATVERACALENIELNIATEVNSMQLQLSLARQGVGWTVIPSAALSRDLAQGSLTGAPLQSQMMQRHLALCLPMARPTSPASRRVSEILLELT